MTAEELEQIAAGGESETVEFKKSTGLLHRAGETLCGFLNGIGGRVFIGITAEGKIVGQQVSDSTLQEVAATLGRIQPGADVRIDRTPLASGFEIVVLEALPSAPHRPYTFEGKAYQRVGSTTSVMPQSRYETLLLERVHSKNRWENAVASGYGLADLDREEILRMVRLGIESGRMPESSGTDIAEILDRLGLRDGGQLLNGAVTLFGTRFVPHFPQCQLRMARFKGITRSEFLDNRQIRGHAFQLLEEAMTFLLRHLPIRGRFEPGRLERIDEPLFPTAALREALVNALCHRDYSIVGGAISLGIYDDRLEIWSDGTLPFGLRPEDLKRDHTSHPRNPLITDMFFRRGLIEQWGRGTQKIVELCVQAGHPEPEFAEQAGSVLVRFLPSGYMAPHRIEHDLTERQREILEVVATGEVSLRELIAQMTTPTPLPTVKDDLSHLKRLGLIQLKGHGRGARWGLRHVT